MRLRKYLCGLMAGVLTGCATLQDLGKQEKYFLILGKDSTMAAIYNCITEQNPDSNFTVIDGWSMHYPSDQPTRKNIIQTLRRLAKQVDSNDTIYVVVGQGFWNGNWIDQREFEGLLKKINPGDGVQFQMTSPRAAIMRRNNSGRGWVDWSTKKRFDFKTFSPNYRKEFGRRNHSI